MKDSASDMERPNIIWVFGDQHRGQALGCAGDPNVHTPNIDRLAAEGVWFHSAVMGFPLCCPSRGSILTGRYPHTCVPGHEQPLPEDATTVAHPFRDAGYHTAYFGKWHLDGAKEAKVNASTHHVPRDRRGGFDTWIGYENNNAQFDCYAHGHRDGEDVDLFKLPTFETDALTDLLLDHVEERAATSQPFFAAVRAAAARSVHRARVVDAPAHAGADRASPQRPRHPRGHRPGTPRARRLLRTDREPRLEPRPHPRQARNARPDR